MEIYNGFYGIWNVDWNLVAHLDPDYAEKYLVKSKMESPTPIRLASNPTTHTTSEMAAEAWHRQREQADRLILRERENRVNHEYNRYIPKDELTEEDKAILDITHAAANSSNTSQPIQPEQYIAPAIPIPATVNQVDEILGTDGDDDDTFFLPGQTEVTTRKRERVKAKSNYRYGVYHTSIPHFKSELINPPIPTVPLLPLPRNFLAQGSKMVMTNGFEYSVRNHLLLDDHSVITVNAVLEDDTYLKIITYQFTLNKVYNTYKFSNAFKKRLVFNKKTGNMFGITWERKNREKKGRMYRRMVGISTQISFITVMGHSFPEKHFRKFTQRMYELTKEKLGQSPITPIMLDDQSHQDEIGRCLLAYLWQHKVGRPLPWIDKNVMDTVSGIREAWSSYHGGRFDEAELKIFPKKPLGKGMFAKLRKKPHPTTLFKSLLGPAYSNTIYRLSLMLRVTHQFHYLLGFAEQMYQNKHLYHFVSHLLNEDTHNAKHVISTLMDAGHGMTYGRDRDQYKSVFVKYVKALEAQFPTMAEEERAIQWELFRDTISMAERYNISVNANQLCKPEEIRALHTRFVRFMNRDASVQRELAGIEFVEFPHPNKEYEGFTFKFLKNAQELTEEGRMMKHCVGGYGTRCVSGQSIIFSMRKNGVGFATLELSGDDPKLKIVQKYSRHDVTITNPEILDIIDKWHKDVLELNKSKTYTYGGRCAIISRYVSGIITIIDKNVPDEMKIPVRQSVAEDDKTIDYLGLRDYVKRVLVNNKRLANKLHNENTDDMYVRPNPWGMIDRRPLPRAVQAPALNLGEVDNG